MRITPKILFFLILGVFLFPRNSFAFTSCGDMVFLGKPIMQSTAKQRNYDVPFSLNLNLATGTPGTVGNFIKTETGSLGANYPYWVNASTTASINLGHWYSTSTVYDLNECSGVYHHFITVHKGAFNPELTINYYDQDNNLSTMTRSRYKTLTLGGTNWVVTDSYFPGCSPSGSGCLDTSFRDLHFSNCTDNNSTNNCAVALAVLTNDLDMYDIITSLATFQVVYDAINLEVFNEQYSAVDTSSVIVENSTIYSWSKPSNGQVVASSTVPFEVYYKLTQSDFDLGFNKIKTYLVNLENDTYYPAYDIPVSVGSSAGSFTASGLANGIYQVIQYFYNPVTDSIKGKKFFNFIVNESTTILPPGYEFVFSTSTNFYTVISTSTSDIQGCLLGSNIFSEALCTSFSYLFIPATTTLAQFGNLWGQMSYKFPFSYVSSVTVTLNALSASSTYNSPTISLNYHNLGIGSTTPLGNILPNFTGLSTSTISYYDQVGFFNSLRDLASIALILLLVADIFFTTKNLFH